MTRRWAFRMVASAAVLWFYPPSRGVCRWAVGQRLRTEDVVRLHLEQLGHCGPRGAARASRLRPGLLAAARQLPGARCPAEAAFALIEQWGEFPRFPAGSGGEF